jgi:hypothetical protein
MKGIYLTEEGKKEIEAKIAELENRKDYVGYRYVNNPYGNGTLTGQIKIYKEILSSAIILPVEESWDNLSAIRNRLDNLKFAKEIYPNGVIIQPKQ